MLSFRNSVRPAIGLFVIAHGLAHSVLPLRGLMDPVALPLDAVPALLYGAAVIGFLIAGFGILGLHPFTIVTRQVLVLASGFSLVAIWRLGDSGMWFGAGTDVLLFVTGLTGAYQYLPQPHPSKSSFHHAMGVTFAVAFITYTFCGTVLWPAHRAWGSETAEHLMSLPGDAADRNRALELQHAITIDAPPEMVWPWIAQIGQDGAVKQVEPGRAIVLSDRALVLMPTADGKTRFIIRTTVSDGKAPAWLAAFDFMAFQLPHFVMERRMMLTIKQLAEQRAAVKAVALAGR